MAIKQSGYVGPTELSVPFTMPAGLTPARIAVSTVVIGGALAAVPAMGLIVAGLHAAGFPLKIQPWSADYALPMIVSTSVLSFLCARRVLERYASGALLKSCLLGGMYGALNPAFAAGLVMLLKMNEFGVSLPAVLIVPVLAGIVLLPLSGIFGVLFGAAYSIPLRFAVRAREAPAHDDVEKALAVCGGWLAVLALAFCVMPFTAWFRTGAALTTLAAITCCALGIVRTRRRRAWLGAVAREEIAGWRIDTTACQDELEPLLPFCRGHGDDYSAVLLTEDVEPAQTPYREKAATRVALVSPADV